MDLRDLDLPAIRARYEAVFRLENRERPVIHLAYPLAPGKAVPMPPPPPSVRDRWFDFDWRLECHERRLAHTGFGLEGFPDFHCNLGPDFMAACMGSDLEFSPTTSWATRRIQDWADTPPLRFQSEGFYWQQMKRFLTLSATRGRGRWLTQSGDLHTNGDGLAALRGPENLLLDLYDCPDVIQTRLAECHAVYETLLQAHFDILLPLSGGFCSSWCSAAVQGRFATIQNDFSCMVSPAQFDLFFKTYVAREAAALDACIYHLDGPDALRHLETISGVPRLHLIQWVPGAGRKPVREWPELLTRIQSLGKGLVLSGTPREQLDMMTFLKPEGCLYHVRVGSREEAAAFEREVAAIHRAKRSVTVVNPLP